MRRLWLAVAAFLILCGTSHAQGVTTPQLIIFNGAPSGSCNSYQMALDMTQGNLYTCSSSAWVRVGSGVVNSGLAHQPAIYPSNGITLSGACSVPTTNGTFPMLFNVTASAAVDPTCPQSGLGSRSITGAATTDTILFSDNQSKIVHDIAGSSSVTESLPTGATLANTNFAFIYSNHSGHSDTISAVTWLIQSGIHAAASTLTVASGTVCTISVDQFNTNQWLADCVATL